MTRAEKVAILKGKSASLIQSFDGRILPAGSFKLNAWATILDAKKYFSTNVAVMQANENPFSRPYVAAYLRLTELKNYLDEHCTTDSQPGPGEDPAKPGN